MSFASEILALSPDGYWRFNDATSAVDDLSGNHADGTSSGTVTRQVPGFTGDGDTALELVSGGAKAVIPATLNQTDTSFSIMIFLQSNETVAGERAIWQFFVDLDNYIALWLSETGTLRLDMYADAEESVYETDAAVDLSEPTSIIITITGTTFAIYVNGAAAAFTVQSNLASAIPTGSGSHHFGAFFNGDFHESHHVAVIDDAAVWWGTTLSAEQAATIHSLASGSSSTDGPVPLSLTGYVTTAGTSVPLRLLGITATAGTSVPLRLEAPDPAHFLESAASFRVGVVLDGVDLSARLTGGVRISHQENASALCTLEIAPSPGALDLNDYERKRLEVSFIADAWIGGPAYSRRRFTGITSSAVHNPDAGTLTIEATTDLQGMFENLPRAAIENLLPGTQWSEYVFDDSADGWQYALDRISTTPAEMHIDEFGHFVVSNWAAKETPDVTFEDASRFENSLSLTRANRRDLLTRVTVNIDYRYSRLRHRQIGVHLGLAPFCDYLNRGWELPSKDMVRSAADSSEWTRIGEIIYTELPGPGEYCNPLRGWTGNAGSFCIGAFWRAARRWAQTVTEEYAITVHCPDLEEAVGRIGIEEDYGVEAVFDASDYEQVKSFSSPPTGSVFSVAEQDYLLDEDETDTGSRAALELAQTVAIAKASCEILRRARTNRVALSPVYRPDLTLSQTVEVSTPYLSCKGKLALIEEVIDPARGVLEQSIEIAISRHGGTGLAVTDPVQPPEAPTITSGTPTARHYYIPFRVGGTTNALADNDEWDGYMTNVLPVFRDPAAPVYDTRLVVRMPGIEEVARNAVEAQQVQEYEIAVPQDPLTIGV